MSQELRTQKLDTQSQRSYLAGAVTLLVVLLLTAIGIASLGFEAGAQTGSDWPQLQADVKRTGQNPQPIRGPFQEKWFRDLGTAIADRIQPVVADGLVVVGDVAGTVHALNETTGETVWTYQTAGPILYTAAMNEDRVFIGSHGGYLYALSAANGEPLWQASIPMGPGGAPLFWNDKVYVAGKNGTFYAFAAADGRLQWQFTPSETSPEIHSAPILSSPAVHPAAGLIYFADENLRAYALDAASGELRWSAQMFGESTYDSWPVVSETQDVVIFRTKSVYGFQASLIHDENDLFCPGNSSGECNSCINLDPTRFDSPAEEIQPNGATAEQWNEQHLMDGDNRIESIDEIFEEYPQRLTFYAFDPRTGQPKWERPAPVLWTGGGGRLGIMPVVDEARGNIYTFWRTKWSRHDLSYFCRRWVDIGNLQVRNNLPTMDFLPCPQGPGSGCRDGDDFHFIGDETSVLSLAGDLLLMTGWYNTGGIYLADVNCPGEACAGNSVFVVGSGYGLPQGGGGSGGDAAAPVSIANKTLFVKHHAGFPREDAETSPFTIIAAYEGQ